MFAVFGICRLGNECSTLVGTSCAFFESRNRDPHLIPFRVNSIDLFSLADGPLIAPADALPRSQGPVGCVGRVRSDLGGAPRPKRSPAAPPAKRIRF